MLSFTLMTVFPLVVAFAASSDLLSMTIPNWVTLVLIAFFAVLAPQVGLSWHDAFLHLATALAVLSVAFAFFAFGWIGGGDAKFAAAIALWMGPSLTVPFLLVTSITGGSLTILMLQLRSYPLPQPLARVGWVARLHNPSEGMPYGIAIAFAALSLYTGTPFFAAVH